jgi:hypothetical protein
LTQTEGETPRRRRRRRRQANLASILVARGPPELAVVVDEPDVAAAQGAVRLGEEA